MSEIIFLSVDQVCTIQASTLPGAPSRNIGLIEGAIGRILNEYLYNGTSDVLQLAALYLSAIAKAHAFPDANKRTALQSSLIFLQINDVFIEENDDLIELTVKAAEGCITIKEIAMILHNHLEAP